MKLLPFAPINRAGRLIVAPTLWWFAAAFMAVARFFRPGYDNHLVQSWLPALNGVVGKLEQGGEVADVGCGHGISTMIWHR